MRSSESSSRLRTRWRPLAVALPAVSRAVRWRPLLGSALAGAVVLWLVRPAGEAGPGSLPGLRLAGLLLCTGAAFVLDDPAQSTLASSPTNIALRRGLRLSLLCAALGLMWTAMLIAAAFFVRGSLSQVPTGAATLEAGGMLALVLALAAVASARGVEGTGGVTAGPALVLAMLGATLGQQVWPEQLTLFPFGPDDPTWEIAHVRWAVVLLAAILVLALRSLDPGRSRPAGSPPRGIRQLRSSHRTSPTQP